MCGFRNNNSNNNNNVRNITSIARTYARATVRYTPSPPPTAARQRWRCTHVRRFVRIGEGVGLSVEGERYGIRCAHRVIICTRRQESHRPYLFYRRCSTIGLSVLLSPPPPTPLRPALVALLCFRAPSAAVSRYIIDVLSEGEEKKKNQHRTTTFSHRRRRCRCNCAFAYIAFFAFSYLDFPFVRGANSTIRARFTPSYDAKRRSST